MQTQATRLHNVFSCHKVDSAILISYKEDLHLPTNSIRYYPYFPKHHLCYSDDRLTEKRQMHSFLAAAKLPFPGTE